jgi:hypothetical protein
MFIYSIWNTDHLHFSCLAECVSVRRKAEIEIFQARQANTDIFSTTQPETEVVRKAPGRGSSDVTKVLFLSQN